MQPVPESVPMLLPLVVGGILVLMLLGALVVLSVWLLRGRQRAPRPASASERARADAAAVLVQQAMEQMEASGKRPDH